ncbi:DUF4114 domain-containing protein [Nostoc sp. FACHB-973]|uniref:DUF4114 domain-containing protein n=1 Tax=Desmonostoc muscorum LEGE 12446 TaxID=1828758 RepID=A0A8J7D014_DESMC|nr:DUF4114 domain-containing protein [Desmonostoc muscorum]MBD2518009.1 DUF4114 domain-containing protein [Nostoc sp. FACHB-973]MBX9255604.1 DUF4114 domain-containing protein [Desmonostoc muscorum CCALA 125]MCF2146401.1 DUF4114 domain-containing protein [Desmonostoc muscorum LEGE 12446]
MGIVPKTPFKIEAKVNCSTENTFFDTEIDLEDGDLLIVDVDPEEKWTPYKSSSKSWVNANGISVEPKTYDGIYQETAGIARGITQYADFAFPFGSLIGTVDNGVTYFPVGTHLELTVLKPGRLKLVFWGGDHNTNDGAITANVEVKKAFNHDDDTIDNDLSQYEKHFDIHSKVHSVNGKAGTETHLNTKIKLQPEDVLTVDVYPKDLWSILSVNRVWDVNANGVAEDNKTRYASGLLTNNFNFTYGSLVGTLDDGKTYFPVGTHLKLTVLNPGTLKFVHWDVNYRENNGSVRAFVDVIRKERPIIPGDDGNIITDPQTRYKIKITVFVPTSIGYNNTFGIFAMDDDGSVAGVKPGDPDYAATVVKNRIPLPGADEGSYQKGDTFEGELLGGPKYGVFLIANGTPNQFLEQNPKNEEKQWATPKAYFFNPLANPDRKDHVRVLSSNEYGFEDLYGGGDQDFDDLIVKIETLAAETIS